MSDPLYDHATERRILSLLCDVSVLSGAAAARLALDQLSILPEDFHLDAHQDAFGAITTKLRQGSPAEAVGLWEALKHCDSVKRAGGLPWLTGLLVNEGGIETALPTYARTVRDLALRRRIFLAARSLMQAAQDTSNNPGDVLSGGSSQLAALVRRDEAGRTLQDVTQEILEELDAIRNGKVEPVLPTGIELLDSVIGGLQPTLTIIGALPGVGKSALLATIAQNLASGGVKVGVFSLEDAGTWIAYRLLSHHSGLGQFTIRNHRLNEHQMGAVADGAAAMWSYGGNLVIDDRSGLTPQDVANTARDWVVNRGVRAVFVDHLGELRYRSGRKDRFDLDVAEGLSDLRAIAKQYGVPVVCAAHLVRGANDRQNGDIFLTDFANSAAIERQARVALGLSRKAGDGRLLVHVLKQTNGKAGVRIELDFHGPAALVRRTGGRIHQDDDAGATNE